MKKIIANQEGQSFVEFILLLALISVLSLGYLKVVNTNLAEFWQKAVTLIVDDETQRLEVR